MTGEESACFLLSERGREKKNCYVKQMLSQGGQRTRTMSLESTQGRAWSPERLMPCVSSCLLLYSKGRRLFSCGSAQVSNEGSQGCWIEISYWGSFVSGETKLLYHKSKCQRLENKSWPSLDKILQKCWALLLLFPPFVLSLVPLAQSAILDDCFCVMLQIYKQIGWTSITSSIA